MRKNPFEPNRRPSGNFSQILNMNCCIQYSGSGPLLCLTLSLPLASANRPLHIHSLWHNWVSKETAARWISWCIIMEPCSRPLWWTINPSASLPSWCCKLHPYINACLSLLLTVSPEKIASLSLEALLVWQLSLTCIWGGNLWKLSRVCWWKETEIPEGLVQVSKHNYTST